jgi:hypothetical protein
MHARRLGSGREHVGPRSNSILAVRLCDHIAAEWIGRAPTRRRS